MTLDEDAGLKIIIGEKSGREGTRRTIYSSCPLREPMEVSSVKSVIEKSIRCIPKG